MPYRDGTGPIGCGQLTGRGLGPCSGKAMGRGFGGRCMPYAEPLTMTKDEQKKVLEASLAELDAETKRIKEKIKEL